MTSWTRASIAAAALVAASLSSADATEPHRPACLSPAETREAMQARRLVPPVRAVEAALRLESGESIGLRLCSTEAAMVYDVAVLRHDGRLVHVLVDAGSGSIVPPRVSH